MKWFSDYGLPIVGITSFLENVVSLSVYFPGSIVILGSMTLAAGNIQLAFYTWCAIVLPSSLAHILNYFLGRITSGKDNVNRSIGGIIVWSTLWHPHFASVTSFTMGSSGIGFASFAKLFFPAHISWNIFWGVVAYTYGSLGKGEFSFTALFYISIVVWIVWDLYRVSRAKKQLNS